MNRRGRTLVAMVVVIGVLSLAAFLLQPPARDGRGSIAMLDVGQGDSFLITAPSGAQLLIDGGKDSKVLAELARVMPVGDRRIEVVIATHPDADHIGGLGSVLERYDVGLFLASGVEGDTQVYRDLLELVGHKQIPAYVVQKGMNVVLDPFTRFETLFPDRDVRGWETNTASVVGKLTIGKRSALFTGDSPRSIETYLARTYRSSIDVDLLKLGHHGSKTSSDEVFLRATSPALALISAGVDNRYGHPAQEVINRLRALRIPSVSTQEAGTVVWSTDGAHWRREEKK